MIVRRWSSSGCGGPRGAPPPSIRIEDRGLVGPDSHHPHRRATAVLRLSAGGTPVGPRPHTWRGSTRVARRPPPRSGDRDGNVSGTACRASAVLDLTGGPTIINGVDVRHLTRMSSVEPIAPVPQHPPLVSGTIEANSKPPRKQAPTASSPGCPATTARPTSRRCLHPQRAHGRSELLSRPLNVPVPRLRERRRDLMGGR